MNETRSTLPDDYASIVAFYDSGYEALLETRHDAEFYLALAREAAGPVLELGCGTGRALLPIAETGFPCTGLDASSEMLRALRAKRPPESIRLVHAPMQHFDLGQDRFTLIFSAFRAFQHLLEVEEQLACLGCVRRHLAPGGIFAFDVFNPSFSALASTEQPEHEDLRFHHQGREMVRYASVRHDRTAQRLHVAMRYAPAGATPDADVHATTLTLRYFFRFELEHLLARAGFRDVRIYGSFDRDAGAQGDELVVVARA